jgi:hypothetical protein
VPECVARGGTLLADGGAMTKQRLISGVLLGWFVVTGCGGESAAEGTPSPDEVEEEQEEDETEPPGVSAYESLTECAAVEPCQGESSFAQMIEGDSSRILHAGTACVLAGLRDRTPGRYLHQTDATWGNGSAGSHHVILIRHDGIVLYTRDSYASGTFARRRAGAALHTQERGILRRLLRGSHRAGRRFRRGVYLRLQWLQDVERTHRLVRIV